jgi:hypothetical protein
MCDYSLMTVPNRLAVEGEELAAHRFQSGSVGLLSAVDLKNWRTPKPSTAWDKLKSFFTAEKDPQPAVCIPPGARLRLYDIPDSLRDQYHIGSEAAVTFAQLSAQAGRYRDAIVFANGQAALLQELEEGQRVRVLWLSMEEIETREPEERLSRIMA